MIDNREDHINLLRAHAKDTLHFLSNAMKPEREKAVCRALLRCMSIHFFDNEIIVPVEEPVDVSYRTARFQIRELMEDDRRRGDEWKKKQCYGKNPKQQKIPLSHTQHQHPFLLLSLYL